VKRHSPVVAFQTLIVVSLEPDASRLVLGEKASVVIALECAGIVGWAGPQVSGVVGKSDQLDKLLLKAFLTLEFCGANIRADE
jgi:hypothetical protein